MPPAESTSSVDARTFRGEEVFQAAPQRTFEALADPDVIARCIPDLVSSERVDDRMLQCIVKPGFSFIRAKMKMTVALSEVEAPGRTLVLDIASKGIGASMKVRCRVSVHEHGEASRIEWEARITELGGLIAAVSPTLIRGAADKIVHEGWSRLRGIVER